LNIETHDWPQKPIHLNSLFSIYYGVNSEKYLEAQEYFASHPGKILWNWAAALLGPLWLFYRKMYGLLLIWLSIAILFDFIYFAAPLLDPDLTNPLIATTVDYYGLLSFLFVLATNVLLGCWGTYYYLQNVQRMVSLVKANAPNNIAVVILSQKGNPSKWRLAGAVLLISGVYFMTYLSACIWLMIS